MNASRTTVIAAFIASTTFLAASVIAAPPAPPAPPTPPAAPPAASPAADPASPLSGPPVAKDAGTGQQGFGEKGGPKGNNNKERPFVGMAAERRNMELWRRAFEQVMPTLSPEVQEQVRALRSDFETQMKSFREANGDKIKAFEQQAKERNQSADGAKKKPDPAVMQEIQKLKDSAPKVEVVQQKIWTLLTPEQQAAFKTSYDAIKTEAEQRKEDRKDGKDGKSGKSGKDGMTDPMQPDPMLPGGETPGKRPDGRPFNFDKTPDDPARKGDGKPSGK